jgi:dTDP-4-dehydrorhamnose reductase
MMMPRKKILITGSNGLLGQKVVDLFARCGTYELLLTSKRAHSVFREDVLPYLSLDLSNRQAVRKIVDEFEPEIIINTAAMTDVDKCETQRAEAWKTNVVSVENLTVCAKLVGAHLIHISTDYVFDGKNGPYSEDARPNPINYYGRTKLAAENVILTNEIKHTIVRTIVLYGTGIDVKLNFGLWLYQQFTEEKPVRAFDDMFTTPTLADDAAYALLKIVELQRTGIYHIAGPDFISRYEFAVKLAQVFGFDKKLVIPVKSASLKMPAQRPLRSGFITLKAETDLGIKTSNVELGLMVLKNQLGIEAQKTTQKKAVS